MLQHHNPHAILFAYVNNGPGHGRNDRRFRRGGEGNTGIPTIPVAPIGADNITLHGPTGRLYRCG